jgi:hypothetical protein
MAPYDIIAKTPRHNVSMKDHIGSFYAPLVPNAKGEAASSHLETEAALFTLASTRLILIYTILCPVSVPVQRFVRPSIDTGIKY